MSQRDQNAWHRLASVIEWSDMTINHFAKHIGLVRSERLYQIQRGNNGVSRKLAEEVVASFPQINLTWLLSGRGEMLIDPMAQYSHIDLYDVDVERFDGDTSTLKAAMRMVLPTSIEADFAMRYCGDAMSNTIGSGSVVILKEVRSEAIIPGGEYVVVTGEFAVLRIVRHSEKEGVWRLMASQSEKYDDLFVSGDDIVRLYRVAAKLIVNN
ncbi:MAG: S24 family peptidase [Rikenellaceae bacterium]